MRRCCAVTGTRQSSQYREGALFINNTLINFRLNIYGRYQMVLGWKLSTGDDILGHCVGLLIPLDPDMSWDPTKRDSAATAFQEDKPIWNNGRWEEFPKACKSLWEWHQLEKDCCGKVKITFMVNKMAVCLAVKIDETEGSLLPWQKSRKFDLNPSPAPDDNLLGRESLWERF